MPDSKNFPEGPKVWITILVAIFPILIIYIVRAMGERETGFFFQPSFLEIVVIISFMFFSGFYHLHTLIKKRTTTLRQIIIDSNATFKANNSPGFKEYKMKEGLDLLIKTLDTQKSEIQKIWITRLVNEENDKKIELGAEMADQIAKIRSNIEVILNIGNAHVFEIMAPEDKFINESKALKRNLDNPNKIKYHTVALPRNSNYISIFMHNILLIEYKKNRRELWIGWELCLDSKATCFRTISKKLSRHYHDKLSNVYKGISTI